MLYLKKNEEISLSAKRQNIAAFAQFDEIIVAMFLLT